MSCPITAKGAESTNWSNDACARLAAVIPCKQGRGCTHGEPPHASRAQSPLARLYPRVGLPISAEESPPNRMERRPGVRDRDVVGRDSAAVGSGVWATCMNEVDAAWQVRPPCKVRRLKRSVDDLGRTGSRRVHPSADRLTFELMVFRRTNRDTIGLRSSGGVDAHRHVVEWHVLVAGREHRELQAAVLGSGKKKAPRSQT